MIKSAPCAVKVDSIWGGGEEEMEEKEGSRI
jgi:hypothetical protein